MSKTDIIYDKVKQVCKLNTSWNKDWAAGGCYIHLEVSEFIESLRGKGSDAPSEEAADVIISLFAVLQNYGITAEEVMSHADKKLDEMLSELK